MKSKAQRGAGIVEYLLLMALILIISLAALKGFGEQLGLTFSEISSAVDNPESYQPQ